MKEKEIHIRKLIFSDAVPLTSLANNKKIWNNLRDYIPHPYSKSDADFFINSIHNQEPQQTFGITYKNQFCGIISILIQEDVYRNSGEIGYWIGEPYWNKGIAKQAVSQITEYGFNSLHLTRIYAGVFEHNIASMRALEKNGYQKEGVFQKAIVKNDQILDEHRYFILNKTQQQ